MTEDKAVRLIVRATKKNKRARLRMMRRVLRKRLKFEFRQRLEHSLLYGEPTQPGPPRGILGNYSED
jgi:hypothetical protein